MKSSRVVLVVVGIVVVGVLCGVGYMIYNDNFGVNDVAPGPSGVSVDQKEKASASSDTQGNTGNGPNPPASPPVKPEAAKENSEDKENGKGGPIADDGETARNNNTENQQTEEVPAGTTSSAEKPGETKPPVETQTANDGKDLNSATTSVPSQGTSSLVPKNNADGSSGEGQGNTTESMNKDKENPGAASSGIADGKTARNNNTENQQTEEALAVTTNLTEKPGETKPSASPPVKPEAAKENSEDEENGKGGPIADDGETARNNNTENQQTEEVPAVTTNLTGNPGETKPPVETQTANDGKDLNSATTSVPSQGTPPLVLEDKIKESPGSQNNGDTVAPDQPLE